MDYMRIYRDFIESRKAQECVFVGYGENHHIVPRCMGGGNEPDNIVRLTPEDHFFAHLLLARVYRGKMSSALFCMMMITQNHWGRRALSRGRYGLAKRLAAPSMSEEWSGKKNPLFNPTVFKWVNYRSGDRRAATLFDMHVEFGGSRGAWTSVASGARPSVFGWLLEAKLEVHKRSEKGQPFDFVNRDGQSFRGTQSQFVKFAGINDASAWRVVHSRSVTKCGWRLAGVTDRRANCPRDGSNPGRAGKVIKLRNGSLVISGDRNAVAAALGKTVGQISAAVYAIRKKQVSSYMGWVLEQ